MIAPITTQAADTAEISDTYIVLKVGKTKKISVRNDGKGFTWISSNKAVAKVTKKVKNDSTAVITAKDEGVAVITATNDKKTYTCSVVVMNEVSTEKPKGETSSKAFRDITVFEKTGTVNITRGKKSLSAVKDMKLKNSDYGVVGNDAFLRLCMDDDSYAYFESGTEFAVQKGWFSKIRVSMTKGEMVVEVQKKLDEDDSFTIETPNTCMAIRGTVVAIKAVPGKKGAVTTYNYVLEGSAEVTLKNGKTVTLNAGEGLSVTSNAKGKVTKNKPVDIKAFEFKDIDVDKLKGTSGKTSDTGSGGNGSDDAIISKAGLFDKNGNKVLDWSKLKIQVTDGVMHDSESEKVKTKSDFCKVLNKLEQKDLTLVIPETVTEIGSGVFFGVDQISKVVIPDSVTKIGDHAFANMDESKLESVLDEDGVVYFTKNRKGDRLEFTSALTEVNIPDGVTSIGDYAFFGCVNLQSINIPFGVISIGRGAFAACIKLDGVIIPDSVTVLGNDKYGSVFEGCMSLTSIEIPESITEIKAGTFYRCTNLTDVKLPQTLTTIRGLAFMSCLKLESIDIPASVTTLETAFNGCSSLKEFTIPDGITELPQAFFCACDSLEKVTIPDSVTEFTGELIFSNCYSLKEINIPYGVTKLGFRTFGDCRSLEKVTIPETVKNIGEDAFYGCTSLTDISIPGSVTKIHKSAFLGCDALSEGAQNRIKAINPNVEF